MIIYAPALASPDGLTGGRLDHRKFDKKVAVIRLGRAIRESLVPRRGIRTRRPTLSDRWRCLSSFWQLQARRETDKVEQTKKRLG